MRDGLEIDEPVVNWPLIGVAVVVLVAALGGWFYWHRHNAPVPVPAAAVVAPAPPAAPPEEAIQHPLPAAADEPQTPLPALNDSDAPFRDALSEAVGGTAAKFLLPESLIRHIVVTVDNLPRQKVALEKRPVAPAPGTFRVNGDELHATLDGANFQRYRPMVELIRAADMQKVAAVYLHFYPLLQKAYQDLGYPTGYFNDRLVQVIDVLLATPQVAEPIELVRPNVMYVFADPSLEARPAGQKLLIRMGPENEAAVKAKLAELRAIVTAAPPKH